MPGYRVCTEVSATCPVSATTYGYYPNLPANIIFTVVFGVTGILQLVLGLRYRTYTWMIGVTLGCLLEMAGYIGRLLMHQNPWSSSGFKLQVVALVLSPSFIAAGIDLTMKHVALTFGKELSRIQPRLYTWVFIGVDIFSIVVQAAGGGIAASGDVHPELLKAGDGKCSSLFQPAAQYTDELRRRYPCWYRPPNLPAGDIRSGRGGVRVSPSPQSRSAVARQYRLHA